MNERTYTIIVNDGMVATVHADSCPNPIATAIGIAQLIRRECKRSDRMTICHNGSIAAFVKNDGTVVSALDEIANVSTVKPA